MSTQFFKNFELLPYSFGNDEDPVLFNNLTQYVDIIDKLKQEVAFLNRYTIVGGDRPDTLSFKLYGTTDYYWTFYLMNDDLRYSGWPVDTSSLLDVAKSKYPNRTLTIDTQLIGALFPVGQEIQGDGSGTVGTIVKRRLDFGQLIVKTTNDNKFNQGETISYTEADGTIRTLSTTKEEDQYNSVHHFENTSGEEVDIFDNNGIPNQTSGLIPITFRDRMEAKNDSLKQIIVIRPDSIDTIVSEFNRTLKQ